MMFGDEGCRSWGAREVLDPGGSMDDILASMGYAGSARGGCDPGLTGRSGPPAPVEATAEITLEEAFPGTTRIVEVGGRRLEVTIPRGVDSGRPNPLSGKGPMAGTSWSSPGSTTPDVHADRADLEREVADHPEGGPSGGRDSRRHAEGPRAPQLPRERRTDRKFSSQGPGHARLRAEGAGDLYVRVKVILPTHLSRRGEDRGQAVLRPRRPARHRGPDPSTRSSHMQLDRFTEKAQEAIVAASAARRAAPEPRARCRASPLGARRAG